MALETPVFLLPDDEGHHWQVSANTGWVSADNSELRLRGDVVTTSPQGQGRPTRMNTQQLNVFPDSSVATSADLVTITQPGLTMSGRGMRADLAAKRYTFQSQVRQRYVP
jgi:lipopolysaccharide export system protein LptC